MAQIAIYPGTANPNASSFQRVAERPLPLRTYSEVGPSDSTVTYTVNHPRRKSTRPWLQPVAMRESLPAVPEPVRESSISPRQQGLGVEQLLTPPATPLKGEANCTSAPASALRRTSKDEPLAFDFSTIDYELDRTRAIGNGLWSSVYLAQPIVKPSKQRRKSPPTPPSTPQRTMNLLPCSVSAVKVPSRPDAKDIFRAEARIITTLQQHSMAEQYLVPFHGFDTRINSLVFEGILGGSLEGLTRRLKVMTELERHLELRLLFPKIAFDLISGLRFIHAGDVVHADIKPANVLLDISSSTEHNRSLVVRARYIDFSASFHPNQPSKTSGGGTWDYMAPEQLRPPFPVPTFASDVWSLGITLLFVIAGESPYVAACGDNVFMLREAIKQADPLGFAGQQGVGRKRIQAVQDFVDCVRVALQKEPGRRVTADIWRRWLDVESKT